MEPSTLSSICKQVYSQFPEVRGVQPSVRPQGEGHFLLVFKGEVSLPGGKTMPRTVRVVANGRGKIEKTTTSR
jgi:hypothetical protein